MRRATLEALRQVGTSPAALDPGFKEELDDLRRAQEVSGERTHETLAAVHETLERVVDRLAAFEDEITEIRGEGLADRKFLRKRPHAARSSRRRRRRGEKHRERIGSL